MTYYDQLRQSCPPPIGTMVGDRCDGYTERLAEAKRVSGLMRAMRPFCFLRMGCGELKYLLIYQSNQLDQFDPSEYEDGPLAGTQHCGNSGLGPKYAERLWKAYEQADYVDFHERNWPTEHLVTKLNLVRKPGTYRNPSKDASMVFLTWVERELKDYCRGRRIGFAGAEARLLEILSKTPEFKEAATNYWPDEADIFFHQPRDNGRDLDANLELVKEDLRAFISGNRLDTLFLSLGSGAKIIGYELSREMGICCFDFGAMMRALTYSGCDGNRVARSPHYPFIFRIPFRRYMDALEEAIPTLTPVELLGKAHGQLISELVKKEVGWTYASWEYDFSEENIVFFRQGFKTYQQRYGKLFNSSSATKIERSGFLHFCGTHRLTLEGRFFLLLFHLKGFARRCLNRSGRCASTLELT
jgi:hypothetical protein